MMTTILHASPHHATAGLLTHMHTIRFYRIDFKACMLQVHLRNLLDYILCRFFCDKKEGGLQYKFQTSLDMKVMVFVRLWNGGADVIRSTE